MLWPTRWTLDNYVDIWSRVPFARLFLNSIIFAGGVTLISVNEHAHLEAAEGRSLVTYR